MCAKSLLMNDFSRLFLRFFSACSLHVKMTNELYVCHVEMQGKQFMVIQTEMITTYCLACQIMSNFAKIVG